MFIYRHIDHRQVGSHGEEVAQRIDEAIAPALGDKPLANGRQRTGPLLCARMLQEYEAAAKTLKSGGMADDAIMLDGTPSRVELRINGGSQLTLCHVTEGMHATTALTCKGVDFNILWSAPPMEMMERNHIAHASQIFMENAEAWQQLIVEACKEDNKGKKLQAMAVNNLDTYVASVFEGTGISFCIDKRHATDKYTRLLIYLTRRRVLDIPLPHDNFIDRLELVRPYLTRLAEAGVKGDLKVVGMARSRWSEAASHADHADLKDPPTMSSFGRRFKKISRLGLLGHKERAEKKRAESTTDLGKLTEAFFAGSNRQYHVDDERRRVIVRLTGGMVLIVEQGKSTDMRRRLERACHYIPLLTEALGKFPFRITGARKVKWTTTTNS